MTIQPIDDTILAELAEAVGRPHADHYRKMAEYGQTKLISYGDSAEEISDYLDQIPDPGKRVKHDGECWKKHAYCLAAKIRDYLPEIA